MPIALAPEESDILATRTLKTQDEYQGTSISELAVDKYAVRRLFTEANKTVRPRLPTSDADQGTLTQKDVVSAGDMCGTERYEGAEDLLLSWRDAWDSLWDNLAEQDNGIYPLQDVVGLKIARKQVIGAIDVDILVEDLQRRAPHFVFTYQDEA